MKEKKKTELIIPEIPCGNEERHALLYFYALEAQGNIGNLVFRERLKKLPPRVRKDYKTGMYFLRRSMDNIWRSLPPKPQMQLANTLKNATLDFKPRNTVEKLVEIVDREDFRAVCNMVISDRCSICVNDPRQQKRCKLRRLMMRVCPPAVIVDGPHCQYMDIAAAHFDGDFFTTSPIMDYEGSAAMNEAET